MQVLCYANALKKYFQSANLNQQKDQQPVKRLNSRHEQKARTALNGRLNCDNSEEGGSVNDVFIVHVCHSKDFYDFICIMFWFIFISFTTGPEPLPHTVYP
jgi:hypothetical protein